MHQIQAGHHFRDRVLHLDSRVHLQKEEFHGVGINNKLHRAGATVGLVGCQRHRGGGHLFAQRLWQLGCRALFDDFLEPALHRAFALEQMHRRAVAMAKHLNFNVARPGNQPFKVDGSITEGLGRKLLGCRH